MIKKTILLTTMIIFFTSCGKISDKVDLKLNELTNKANQLDSIINTEVDKVMALDSIINLEGEKVKKLDSLVNKTTSKLDSLAKTKLSSLRNLIK